MTAQVKKICENCRFATPSYWDNGINCYVVQCRYNAPVVGTDRWAKVAPDSWCGKFEPRQPELKENNATQV